MSPSLTTLKVFFDGGCRPNPGAMEIAVVAGGAVHIAAAGEGSSELAEWRALLHALQVARDMKARSIVLLGDALGVVRQANGAAKARTPEAAACLAAFREQAQDFASLRVRHVKRTQNLAGIALDRRRFR